MKLTKENYVIEAESVMTYIRDNARREKIVSISKIRKILSMVSDIYNDARRFKGNTLDSEMKSRIQYLKLHVVYEAGRDEKGGPVRAFIDKAHILRLIDDIGDSKENLITFCHYMEALVAYHRFFGGNE